MQAAEPSCTEIRRSHLISKNAAELKISLHSSYVYVVHGRVGALEALNHSGYLQLVKVEFLRARRVPVRKYLDTESVFYFQIRLRFFFFKGI